MKEQQTINFPISYQVVDGTVENPLKEGVFRLAEIDISFRPTIPISEMPKITNSASAFEVIKRFIIIEEQNIVESIYVMALNNANRVLGIKHVGTGGITGTVVDRRVVFQTLLKANAVAFIMWHNHPSGKMKASQADEVLTAEIKQGGALLHLTFLDHLIIDSEGNYLSMADEGKM